MLAAKARHSLRIAMHFDSAKLTSGHSQSFASRWLELAARERVNVVEVDAFRQDLFESLKGCDGFMWCFPNAPRYSELGKRVSMAVHHGLRLPMFPDWRTCWFFEDKHAQKYLLEAAGVPMPQTWVFWDEKTAIEFLGSASFPLVVKLAHGIVSTNVRLVRSRAEAEHLTKLIFHYGLTRLPERLAADTQARLRQRISNIYMAALGRRQREHFGVAPIQRDSILFQEFLSDNELDYRITVIGNRAFGYRRFNRPGDFRASGSGARDYSAEEIDADIVELAFETAEKLNSQVLTLDILRRGEELVVVEISYYFEAWLVHHCPGHWRRSAGGGSFDWISGQMRPEDALFRDFIDSLRNEDVSSV